MSSSGSASAWSASRRATTGTLTTLASGKVIPADVVFYSAGRRAPLPTSTSRTPVSRPTRAAGSPSTTLSHVTAAHLRDRRRVRLPEPRLRLRRSRAGSPPATSSAIPNRGGNAPLPIGIYSIPEISYVGKTEPELTEAMIPYETGISHYRELARGQILGESHGLVKLLVSPTDRTLLGVHAFGAGATEVVHIGQATRAASRARGFRRGSAHGRARGSARSRPRTGPPPPSAPARSCRRS